MQVLKKLSTLEPGSCALLRLLMLEHCALYTAVWQVRVRVVCPVIAVFIFVVERGNKKTAYLHLLQDTVKYLQVGFVSPSILEQLP